MLSKALEIINGERQDKYGEPEDSFKAIAELWHWYMRQQFGDAPTLRAHDVAMMMTLFKMARIVGNGYTEDSFVDLCGYAALADDMYKAAQPTARSVDHV